MGFNQGTYASYFVVFISNGVFGNTTIDNVPTPLAPNDIRAMEAAIREKVLNTDDKVVLLDFKKLPA